MPGYIFGRMPRYARLIKSGMVLHVTARGNYGQAVFHAPEDYRRYLKLLERYSREFQLSLLGWCLMTNHVHLPVRSEAADSLSRVMKRTQSEYASSVNRRRHQASGHLWQSRFYSCPVEGPYVWMTLRYIELNPVRARIAVMPEDYSWSSAQYHLGRQSPPEMLEVKCWQQEWSNTTWREALGQLDERETLTLREASRKAIPLGNSEFLRLLEEQARRPLRARRPGRPRLDRPTPSD
jgi:putative transposase